MKNIEEAAQINADRFCKVVVEGTEITNTIEDLNRYSKDDFKAGVAFAQRWYSVSEKLPPLNELVQVKDTQTEEVGYSHEWLMGIVEKGEKEIPVWGLGSKPTHWRKIELK